MSIRRPHYDRESCSLILWHEGQECRVSYEALSDNFGLTKINDEDACLQAFDQNKSKILDAVERKYLSNPDKKTIIVTSEDFLERGAKLLTKIRD